MNQDPPTAWLLTRPQGKNNALKQRLAQVGLVTYEQPLLACIPLELSATDRSRLYNLDQFHYLVSISAFASECFVEAATDVWPQWPVGIAAYAVGPAAAAPLSTAGFATLTPQLATSEGLLTLFPNALAEKRCLLLKGEGGRDFLQQALHARGTQVSPLDFYRRESLPAPADLATWLPTLQGVIITSAQSFTHWLKWMSALKLDASPQNDAPYKPPCTETSWQRLMYVVPSARVAQDVINAGCHFIEISNGANDTDLLEAVERAITGFQA